MGKPRTVQQLADYLEVGTDWVYSMVEAELIPCTRLPSESKTGRGSRRMIRFTDEQVEQILAEGKQPVRPVRLQIPGQVVDIRARRLA